MGYVGDHKTHRRPHVLAIPYFSQGHITPMLRFVTEIAKKGVTVTFVTYETELSRITSSNKSDFEILDIRFVGLHNASGIVHGRPSKISALFEEAFHPLKEKLLHDKLSGVPGPTSILSDMFIYFSQDLGDRLQIPRYVFVPSGAIFARFIQGSGSLFKGGQVQISETDGKLVEFDGSVRIPGLPALRYHELPHSTRNDPGPHLRRCEIVRRAAGVLVNSFYELEENVLESWKVAARHGLDSNKVSKIYPIGPLSFAADQSVVVSKLEDSANHSLRWLSSQPITSVLYAAFGTLVRLSPYQINELALGLESSKQHFLWVLPDSECSSAPITDMLPLGFQARVGDRGCVVTGWVPQLDILAHPSTSAFLTHSGWNSTLEGITLGVPMIAWPQFAEQHINCRYVVDDLKVGYELDGGAKGLVNKKDVAKVVRQLMIQPEGRTIRNRVKELQKKCMVAVGEGGSRSRAIQEFVDDLFSPS